MTEKHLKLLKIISVLLIISLIILGYILVNKVKKFEEYHKYFSQPIKSQSIETWMNFNQIDRVYHIDIKKVLWKDIWIFEMREPISDYCKKEKINCDALILELNKIKNGH